MPSAFKKVYAHLLAVRLLLKVVACCRASFAERYLVRRGSGQELASLGLDFKYVSQCSSHSSWFGVFREYSQH